MNTDPDGTFGILATILISVIAGAIISSCVSVGKQLIENDGDFSKVNLREVGSAALTGAALGLAVGLGGAVGAAIKGVATLSITAGQALGIALGVNFVAGIGAYAIENVGTNNFNAGEMIMNGVSQTGKALVNFIVGGTFAASGLWGIGKGVKGSASLISRAIGKFVITFIPFSIFNFMGGR